MVCQAPKDSWICEEYFVEYCLSRRTLLWTWIMICQAPKIDEYVRNIMQNIVSFAKNIVEDCDEWLRRPQKYPCLFSKTGTLAKTIATSVIQYHLIPGRILASQDLQNLAAVADFMATTALPDQTLNVTVGGTKLNGYSQIDNPDIGTKESQVVHGIKMLLVPPSLLVRSYLQSPNPTQLLPSSSLHLIWRPTDGFRLR